MTIRDGEWRPNTCTCVINFEYDDAVPTNERLHTVTSAERGVEHASIEIAEVLYQTTLNENRRLNGAKEIADQVSPAHSDNLEWAFTEGRLLKISFTTQVPGIDKTNIQFLCDEKFGLGVIEVS